MYKNIHHQQIELQIDAIVSDGRGLGRFENTVVFVPHTVPGQKVLATITARYTKFLEAKIDRVIIPSQYERAPLCPHSEQCGGCTWQNVQYNYQLFWKQQIVKDALERIGKVHNPNVLDIIRSPCEWGYRNKMVFTFAPSSGLDNVILGLKMKHSHQIIPITSCLLQSENTMKIVKIVRNWIKSEQQILKTDLVTLGYFRFLVIRESLQGDILIECIVNTKKLSNKSFNEELFGNRLSVCLQEITSIRGLLFSQRTQPSDVAYSEYIVWYKGEHTLREQVKNIPFLMGNNNFSQVNTKGAERVYLEVISMAHLTGGELVWDLYAGIGSISFFLAPFVWKVIGVESNRASMKLAKKMRFSLGYKNCFFIEKDVYTFMKLQMQKKEYPNIVVVDPPRAGLSKKVIEMLIRLAPKRCIYISCNPGTLARDIAMLSPYFLLQQTRPIDLFPHTPHIETVSNLVYNV